jgi:hypothetical protein
MVRMKLCRKAQSNKLSLLTSLEHDRIFFSLVETPFYLQSVYIHSINWCEDWLGEWHSLVSFHSFRVMTLLGRGGIIIISETT